MAYGNALLDRLAPSSQPSFTFDDLSLVDYELLDRIDSDGAIDHVVFPATCVISLLTTGEGEGPVELATVGNEGFVGTPLLLGSDRFLPGEFAQCQVPGAAWRMDGSDFLRLVGEDKGAWSLLARYVQAYQSLLSRQVLCNLLHPIEQRVCRWLLVTGDRANADEFPLTQDFLSEMLGVRRASVNVAERRLQGLGLISYGRGRMRLLDRGGLEDLACTCYHIMNERYDTILR